MYSFASITAMPLLSAYCAPHPPHVGPAQTRVWAVKKNGTQRMGPVGRKEGRVRLPRHHHCRVCVRGAVRASSRRALRSGATTMIWPEARAGYPLGLLLRSSTIEPRGRATWPYLLDALVPQAAEEHVAVAEAATWHVALRSVLGVSTRTLG